ncbi:MAG: VCBS repeat-containing protein [Verrucomicrobia bacterium]|nr:VCBS repeat-containing protein [Verrucomicrobiota bacterium]
MSWIIRRFLESFALPEMVARVRLEVRVPILCSVFGCLVLGGVGCSKDESAGKAGDSAAVRVQPLPAADPVESIVDGGETKETARLWSDPVKAQLAGIAEAMMAVDGEVPASIAGRIEMTNVNMLQSKEVYDEGGIKVDEIATPGDSDALVEVGAADFLQKMRALLHLTSEDGDETHFKLYGIDREGEHLKTRQRLMSVGTREGKQVRSYAVVDAKWGTPADDDVSAGPRLISFSMSKLVQSELEEPDTMFDDIAATVLGNNAAWREQLQPGMNSWGRHIERSLNPDFLGYHGVAIGDVDGDGLEDLYLCQPGGLPNLLFRQKPDGTLEDISDASRVDWLDNSTGALLVDLDNDGDADLAVATRGAFLVMENDGKGKFSLRERLTNVGTGYSPTAADYDLDGDLDLLVLRYAGEGGKTGDFPTPHPFHNARNGGANVLLQNQGDFGFDDVTDDCGLGVENYRYSFAASWEDFDNDGDLDLYIANDFGPNQLFRNERTHFVDESVDSGTQDWGFGMSATWGDYDRDGSMDLYVSSMFSGAGNQVIPQSDFNPSMPEETRQKYLKMVRGNTLMRNLGDGRFADVTSPADEGFAGWAWGSRFADLNNDGWEDLYVANGYISQPDKDDL